VVDELSLVLINDIVDCHIQGLCEQATHQKNWEIFFPVLKILICKYSQCPKSVPQRVVMEITNTNFIGPVLLLLQTASQEVKLPMAFMWVVELFHGMLFLRDEMVDESFKNWKVFPVLFDYCVERKRVSMLHNGVLRMIHHVVEKQLNVHLFNILGHDIPTKVSKMCVPETDATLLAFLKDVGRVFLSDRNIRNFLESNEDWRLLLKKEYFKDDGKLSPQETLTAKYDTMKMYIYEEVAAQRKKADLEREIKDLELQLEEKRLTQEVQKLQHQAQRQPIQKEKQVVEARRNSKPDSSQKSGQGWSIVNLLIGREKKRN